LGVKKVKEGRDDPRAEVKHKDFLQLLQKVLSSPIVKSADLRAALTSLIEALEHNKVKQNPKYSEITNKDWVSFIINKGTLANQHLFEHPDVKAFWLDHLASMVSERKETKMVDEGVCSICGNHRKLIRNLPTKIKLFAGRRQLMSINADAFVSHNFYEDDAHLQLCFSCGENAIQTLNYLLDPNNKQHNQVLMLDKTAKGRIDYNSLRNLMAAFWLRKPERIEIDDRPIDFIEIFSSPIKQEPGIEPTLNLLETFLKIPWSPEESLFLIPNNRFYLAVLSPNGKGRVAVREWLALSLEDAKDHLRDYVQALKIIGPTGEEPRAFSIPRMVEIVKNPAKRQKQSAGESKHSVNILDLSPNLVRGLLRTAYLGEPPPSGLLERAVGRLRSPSGREDINFWVLASIIKLVLTFKKEEARTMVTLYSYQTEPAYLCGRLLAVLEEIQRRAAYPKKLNTTIVDRYYGGASLTPKATLGGSLLNLAEKGHLPKLRRDQRGHHKMRSLVEEIMSALDQAGGFPPTLNLAQQAEFALGFYHQRVDLRPVPAQVIPQDYPTREEV
jgi:CRISPR-associated protein Csd1